MTFLSPKKVNKTIQALTAGNLKISLPKQLENEEEDFDFIDPAILEQFKQQTISIEKIQKEIFNFDEKGK